ncbi:hypothetical protein [Streptomyces sp. NPDC097619]|uniref:hypothetical protein n=1 Tax=Streptomyces sp. NPDC097619 TaxID=3157228 RepID=UPI003329D4EF
MKSARLLSNAERTIVSSRYGPWIDRFRPGFHPTHHDTVRRERVQLTADGVRRRPTTESLPTG